MASHRLAHGTRRTLLDAAGAVLATLLLAGPVPDAKAEALRQAPNSHIAMEIGQSFTASTRFTGFLDEASGASYLIVEMQASAYEEVKKLADRPDALANNGITETQRGILAGRTGEYAYVTGRQRTPSGDFAKFLLIMRENGVTAMITANIPQTALDDKVITREEVERALASATVQRDTGKSVDLFRLSYLGPFKEAQGLIGTTKAYTLNGKPPERSNGKTAPEPVFIVSPSLGKEKLPDLAAATVKSFRTLGGFRDHSLIGESELTVGALRAYGAVGEGIDIRSGTKNSMYVVIVAGQAGGYYVMVGTCPLQESAFFLQEFQNMAMSFRPVRD
jgi:hypothetical protein